MEGMATSSRASQWMKRLRIPLLMGFLAVVGWMAFLTFDRVGQPIGGPINVQRSEIVSVQIRPYPEGPYCWLFTRSPERRTGCEVPLDLVEEDIPLPLPAFLRQGRCDGGRIMTVQLADGRTVTYGPCHSPQAIDRFWIAIFIRLDRYLSGPPMQGEAPVRFQIHKPG